MRRYRIVFLTFCFGLLYGCNGDTSITISEDAYFETTLTVINEDDEVIEVVQQGDPVILSFSFWNVSGENRSVLFSDGQQYDLEVYNSQDTLVWNWANDLVFPQSLTMLAFDIDEEKAYEEIWDQTSNQGNQVPAGIYDVYVNRCWNPEMSAGPIQIEIEESF